MQNWQKIFKTGSNYGKTGTKYSTLAATMVKLAPNIQLWQQLWKNWQQIFKSGSNYGKTGSKYLSLAATMEKLAATMEKLAANI